MRDENNPPDLEDTLIITAVNQPVEWNIEAGDADEDTVSYSIKSAPEIGFLTIENELLTYSPKLDHVGTLEARIDATDNLGATTTALFTIEVTDENTPPIAKDQGVEIFGNKPESFELSIEDLENNPISV